MSSRDKSDCHATPVTRRQNHRKSRRVTDRGVPSSWAIILKWRNSNGLNQAEAGSRVTRRENRAKCRRVTSRTVTRRQNRRKSRRVTDRGVPSLWAIITKWRNSNGLDQAEAGSRVTRRENRAKSRRVTSRTVTRRQNHRKSRRVTDPGRFEAA